MANFAEASGYTNAAAHLRHYLNNSGEDLHINPDAVMRDIDGFRTEVDMSIENEMRRIAEEAEATGRYGEPIQFSTGWAPYSARQSTHPDWFFALGTFSHSTTGEATVLGVNRSVHHQDMILAVTDTEVW